jgi:diguanylate cyclase (GGDEF)-like protein/putative nucleotidyltransferase with HDIG domain
MTPREQLSVSAQVYVSVVILAGAIAVCHSLYVLHLHPVSYHWTLLAGLTLLSGSFTIRIPAIPARLSVSETFVFAAVLLFGPAAATMIVVLDSLVISLWLKQRSRSPSRVLFNVAAPSVAIWIASHIFYQLAGVGPLAQSAQPILPLLVPLLALAVMYFLLNSFLVAWAVSFEKGISAIAVWSDNFLWLSLNYLSGASVAALLLPYLQPERPEFARVIGILLPLLLISYLTFKTAMGRVDDANRHLKVLNGLYLSTIETLAMAIDAKDQITHGHIRRVQVHAVTLARAVGIRDDAQIRAIEAAALLHDMGKLAVPEYILNKPGPLTPAEFDKMKLHASVGADILSAIDFPYPVVPIVRHHHENWNGKGYPAGLSGTAIPIGARILSVVDCFDALTSDRPYRPRLSDSEALSILSERRGQMYDPVIIDAFLTLHAEGGFRQSTATTESSFAAITSSSTSIEMTVTHPVSRFEDINASGEEMLALFELARSLNRPMGISELAGVVVRHLRRIVPAGLSVLYLYEASTDELVSTYVSGEHLDLASGLRIPLGQRLTGWVGANRQVIRNSDPILDLGDGARSVDPRPRSCLSAPLTMGESLIGVLTLYSSGREAFTEDHQRIIEVISRQVAPVLQHALTLDSSGAPRAIVADHNLEIFARKQPSMWKPPLALICVEIEGLEELRTQSGSASGDDVVTDVVSCARKHVRPGDIVFRYENDEIVIVQFKTEKSVATAIAGQIRHAIHEQLSKKTTMARMRISVGVSAMPDDGQSAEGLRIVARRRARRQHGSVNGDLEPPLESIH